MSRGTNIEYSKVKEAAQHEGSFDFERHDIDRNEEVNEVQLHIHEKRMKGNDDVQSTNWDNGEDR